MSTMKLAKAAQQQLKGVIIEYDVLCSTLIGRSVSEQAAQQRQKLAAAEQQAQQQQQQSSGLFGSFGAIRNMFVTDVRSVLKDLNEDSTGKPWVVKDRLQSVMQGLPAQYIDKMTNEPPATGGKSADELHLEAQLATAAAERERERDEKLHAARSPQSRLDRMLAGTGGNSSNSSSGGSAARDKYLSKIQALKAKAKQAPTAGRLDVLAENVALTSKGLSTWTVNEGANELLSYATTRGLFKGVMPNQAPIQDDEFEFFLKEMDGQFDAIMRRDAYKTFPAPEPIKSLCDELGLTPAEVLVVARSSLAIRAAKAAGTHTCHFQLHESDIPNHTAHYRIAALKDFQFLVEDFNGISYRGKTPEIMW